MQPAAAGAAAAAAPAAAATAGAAGAAPAAAAAKPSTRPNVAVLEAAAAELQHRKCTYT